MQPTFLRSGTTPLPGDTEQIYWTRILGNVQNRPGSNPRNDPAKTDTVWRLKYKLGLAVSSGSTGGGGGGGGTGDADVDAFLTCSSITDPLIIGALLALVQSFKNDGVWATMDAIYPFVGGNATAHSCNLRDTSKYSITWNGSVSHSANGITGDGATGYGDTGFNPTTAAGNYALNSASLGVYNKTLSPLDNTFFLGCGSGGGPTLSNLGKGVNILGDEKVLTGINLVTGFVSDNTDFTGSIVGSRTANTTTVVYFGATSDSSALAATGMPSENMAVLAQNISGTPGAFSNANLAFAFIGAGFSGSQVSAIRSAILTFETTLGRA